LLRTLCPDLYSQSTGDIKEDFLYGEYYNSKKQFQEALPFYLSVFQKDTNHSYVNYRIGECYYSILGSQNKAYSYLQRATKEVEINYDDKSANWGSGL
jgi:tetratricopeptide (TPR) repeat protein